MSQTVLTYPRTGEAAVDPIMGCRTLMKRMGAATGADLSRALAEGAMGALELRDMVARCSGCTCKDACTAWLDTHLEDDVQVAPVFCANRAEMDAIAGR